MQIMRLHSTNWKYYKRKSRRILVQSIIYIYLINLLLIICLIWLICFVGFVGFVCTSFIHGYFKIYDFIFTLDKFI